MVRVEEPSGEVERLRAENRALEDRLARLEKTVQELAAHKLAHR
jgi:hypothetical protein